MIVIGGGNIAADLVGELRVEADAFRGERHVPVERVANGPRRAKCFERRERLHVRGDEVGETPQHTRTFARRDARPAARAPCRPCVLHGAVDGGGVGDRHRCVEHAIGWARYLDARAKVIIDIGAADEMSTAHADRCGIETVHFA
jgi:hypothetical protein